MDYLLDIFEAEGDTLFLERWGAESGLECELKRGAARNDLLGVSVVVGLNPVGAWLGHAENELLGAVAAGEIPTDEAALIGEVVIVFAGFSVWIGNPQVDIGVVGVPCKDHAQVKRHRPDEARIDCTEIQPGGCG